MTRERDFKARVRFRMQVTGERYTTARSALEAELVRDRPADQGAAVSSSSTEERRDLSSFIADAIKKAGPDAPVTADSRLLGLSLLDADDDPVPLTVLRDLGFVSRLKEVLEELSESAAPEDEPWWAAKDRQPPSAHEVDQTFDEAVENAIREGKLPEDLRTSPMFSVMFPIEVQETAREVTWSEVFLAVAEEPGPLADALRRLDPSNLVLQRVRARAEGDEAFSEETLAWIRECRPKIAVRWRGLSSA